MTNSAQERLLRCCH